MRKISPLFLLLMLPLFAYASWYDQKLEGWYYFEEPTSSQAAPPLTPQEADEYLSVESHTLKQLLSLAIVSPTADNVENYIRSQRKWIKQSNLFADTWGTTLLEHPELGDFLTTPTSSHGILAQRAHELKQRKELLQKLSTEYFLVFFFKGKDPLSIKASEVVQLFAASNGWKYKAVSLDGVGCPQLHDFALDQGISDLFEVRATPSLFIVNPTEKKAYPVGAGLISVSEIEQNIGIQLQEDEKN